MKSPKMKGPYSSQKKSNLTLSRLIYKKLHGWNKERHATPAGQRAMPGLFLRYFRSQAARARKRADDSSGSHASSSSPRSCVELEIASTDGSAGSLVRTAPLAAMPTVCSGLMPSDGTTDARRGLPHRPAWRQALKFLQA